MFVDNFILNLNCFIWVYSYYYYKKYISKMKSSELDKSSEESELSDDSVYDQQKVRADIDVIHNKMREWEAEKNQTERAWIVDGN